MIFTKAEIATIKRAQTLAFPTDTVAGLFAPIANTVAIEKLFLLKQRSIQKTMMLLLPDQASITNFFAPNAWQWRIIQANSPGQISFIMPCKDDVNLSPHLYSVENTCRIVGFRIPDSVIAQSILQITGVLAQTSLNLSGQSPISTSQDIPKNMDIDFVYQFQDLAQTPSTIVRLYDDHCKVIRQGKSELVLPQ